MTQPFGETSASGSLGDLHPLGSPVNPSVRAQEPALGLRGDVGVDSPATGRGVGRSDKCGVVSPIERDRLGTCLLGVAE
jgi:hypothetical protein